MARWRDLVQLTTYVEPRVAREVAELAKRDERAVSYIVREAVLALLEARRDGR